TISELQEDKDVKVEFEEIPAETYTLTLTAKPEEGGTISGEGEYEENEKVSLSATPEDEYEFVNWTDADGEISDKEEFEYSMPAEDVTLEANFEKAITSIDPALSESIEIYPNPTEGEFSLKTDNPEGYVKILNLTGKIILEKQINKDILHIDLSDQPSGVYLIKITSDENTLTKKLILN
ncbi:MAG: InlB B-repeat-containing protein, partial [Bacteroidota bacterium]